MEQHQKALWQEIVRYSTGFLLSLIITVFAYAAVVNKLASGDTLLYSLAGLALVQAIVQLIFFLKLGREEGAKWRLAAFASMLVVLLIVVIGSIWIMHHLNYNMTHMSKDQIQEKMDRESGF